MKKLLLLLVVVLSSMITYAQDTTKAVVDTNKLSFKEVYTDVKEGIKGIAVALKQPAEYVYSILVKQSVVNSITNLLIYIIMGVVVWFCYKRLRAGLLKLENKDHPWYRDEIGEHTSIIIPLIAVIVLGLSLAIGVCCTLTSTITGFVNPEYDALQSIFNFIKNR